MAVGTLTAIRIGPPTRVDRPVARVAMLLAPVAVLPLAVLVAAVGWLGHLVQLSELVAAALAVGALALANRALHLDGLADTADGLAASYDRERALAVMKRGDTGPAGVVTLVLALLVQVSALAAVLAEPWGPVAAGVTVCLSRLALPALCVRGVPAARPGGLGAAVAGTVGRTALAAVVIAGAAAAVATARLTGAPLWEGAVTVALASLIVGALVIRCCRRLGGITGDVLGAAVEITWAAMLIGFAAA